jgi:hypothetical protein
MLRGPIIQIEPIYVEVGSYCPALKKQSRLAAARALSPKIEGVYKNNLSQRSQDGKITDG